MLAGLLVPWYEFVINSTTSALGDRTAKKARDDAEETARLAEKAKGAAKKKARKAYKTIVETLGADSWKREQLAPIIAPFAPLLAQDILPPSEAVKFDLLIADVVALQALYSVYYAILEDDEEAILTIIMAS